MSLPASAQQSIKMETFLPGPSCKKKGRLVAIVEYTNISTLKQEVIYNIPVAAHACAHQWRGSNQILCGICSMHTTRATRKSEQLWFTQTNAALTLPHVNAFRIRVAKRRRTSLQPCQAHLKGLISSLRHYTLCLERSGTALTTRSPAWCRVI